MRIAADPATEAASPRTPADARAVLDATDEPVVVVDPASFEVLDLNGAAATAFAPADDVLGRHFAAWRGLDDAPWRADDLIPRLREAAAGTPQTIDWPAGGERWHTLRVVATTLGGQPRLLVWVRERGIEEQLRRAQRMEAVGRLAGGIAHDFNNMLAVILNYADFALQRSQNDARLREYLTAIRTAAARSTALTRQLMIFGRRDVVVPEILDLNDAVAELARLLRRTLGEDVQLETSLARDLPPVRIARSQAEQVLMNLTVNARDAMPRGGRLTVTTRLVANAPRRPGRWVQLEVRDNGVGMPPEVLALAFEPFFTTKAPGEGTGLGLSIVYGIVDEAGGWVEVDSTPGEGTTFRIHLPAAARATARVEDVQPDAAAGAGESVLVVEDEPEVRTITAEILRQGGYDVHVVETPEAALEACRRRDLPFDLLLTDVVMPRISGSDLATLVGALRPGTRVLFMSGHADEHLNRHRMDPATAYLQKPFGRNDLLRAVKTALEARTT